MSIIHQHYPVIILGATLSGIGAALSTSSSPLIIERSGGVGQEFIETFNPGSMNDESPSTPLGQSLANELRERNIMDDLNGPVHLAAMHPVLCKRLLDAKVDILFHSEIMALTSHNQLFELTLFNASGIQTITTERIIDTTSQRLSQLNGRYKAPEKTINVFLHTAEDSDIPLIEESRAKFVRGRFHSERILKWSVEPDSDWSAARRSLLEFWQARPAALQSWSIAALASSFECLVPRGEYTIEDNWTWLPSEGYGHPLEAFEQGILFQQRMKEGMKHGNS